MPGVDTTHWVAESVPSRGRAPDWPDRDPQWRIVRLASCESYIVLCRVTIARREAPLGPTLNWAPSSRLLRTHTSRLTSGFRVCSYCVLAVTVKRASDHLLGPGSSLPRVLRVSDVRLGTHGCLDYLLCARPSAPMCPTSFPRCPSPCDCSCPNCVQSEFGLGRGRVIGPLLMTPVRAPVGDWRFLTSCLQVARSACPLHRRAAVVRWKRVVPLRVHSVCDGAFQEGASVR